MDELIKSKQEEVDKLSKEVLDKMDLKNKVGFLILADVEEKKLTPVTTMMINESDLKNYDVANMMAQVLKMITNDLEERVLSAGKNTTQVKTQVMDKEAMLIMSFADFIQKKKDSATFDEFYNEVFTEHCNMSREGCIKLINELEEKDLLVVQRTMGAISSFQITKKGSDILTHLIPKDK